MRQIPWVLLLLPAMSWATSYKCEDQGRVIYSATPCGNNAQVLHFKDDQAISQGKLVLRMDAGRSFRAPGTVNGHAVTFVVDTGASNTVISQQVADAAGIRSCSSSGYVSTANGMVRKCVATVPEITFGEFHIKNLAVTILPNLAADGLLGMDVLRRMKIEQQDGLMYISNE